MAMERSRAHFAYAERYLDVGDRRSIAKAIAHFGRGMAYGSFADKILSNAGPYTYHWKLNDRKHLGHYATIDVTNPKGQNVATITVYSKPETTSQTEPMEFSVAVAEQQAWSDLTSRYIAREVSSVIRYIHRTGAFMIKTRNMSIPVDPIIVTFNESWGPAFNPLDEWERAERVFKSKGCWPRLSGGSHDKENQTSGMASAMKNLAIRGAGYKPLQEIARPSVHVLDTSMYTNGGLFYRVKRFANNRYRVEVLTDNGCEIAHLEFDVKESSKQAGKSFVDMGTPVGTDAGPPKLAYVRLACSSLIQFLHGSRPIISSPEDDDVAQWYAPDKEKPKSAAKNPPATRNGVPAKMR
jgi:hypothetical protein